MPSHGVGKLRFGETKFQQKESSLRQKVKYRFTRSELAASFCRKLISRNRVQKKKREAGPRRISSLDSTLNSVSDFNRLSGDFKIGLGNQK